MQHTAKNILKSVSIDCVIFGYHDKELSVLLIERKETPNKGEWALPGGFILTDEDMDGAAKRILNDLTGVSNIYMDQLKAFGDVDRYPLRRVITIVYSALVNQDQFKVTPSNLVQNASWFNVKNLPKLPFDHDEIFAAAFKKLQTKVRYEPIGFELLPNKFTLTQLQTLYEMILGVELDKRNFRKKLLAMNLLVKLDEKQTGVSHRAAHLYRFDKRIYNKLKTKGFNFEL